MDFGDESELDIEQRATERNLSQIRLSGYRDGLHKFSEDETSLQLGFDAAYAALVSLAFVCGQIRAIGAGSAKANSAFLAKLNHKIDQIEQNSFENLLVWVNTEEFNAEKLKSAISNLEQRLNTLKTNLQSTTTDLETILDGFELQLTTKTEEEKEDTTTSDLNGQVQTWSI